MYDYIVDTVLRLDPLCGLRELVTIADQLSARRHCSLWGNGYVAYGNRLPSDHRKEADKDGQKQPITRSVFQEVQGVVVVVSI